MGVERVMEFKLYSDGKRTIKATVRMYDMLYRNCGFKPVESNADDAVLNTNSDKGRSNRNNRAKNPADSSSQPTDE